MELALAVIGGTGVYRSAHVRCIMPVRAPANGVRAG